MDFGSIIIDYNLCAYFQKLMEQNKSNIQSDSQQNQDFVKLQEWFSLCIAKWHWFLISMVIVGGLAVLYVLKTTPTYTRKASILIKDDDGSNSLSKEFGQFSDMAFGKSRTNIQNEMITLKSLTYMKDVVQALHLDINYTITGYFHDFVIYGKDLPVNVVLPDVDPNQSAGFTLKINNNNLELYHFSNSKEENKGKVVHGKFNTPIQTPIGKVIVTPTKAYVGKFDQPIHVKKVKLQDCESPPCGFESRACLCGGYLYR